MSNIILFNLTSLDGIFAGPQGEIDWHNVDAEFNQFAIDQLDAAEGLIFGRKTYELMVSYWPTQVVRENDPIIAGKMNSLPKIVFSRTLDRVEWTNSRLVKENLVEEISSLKQKPGKDWFIFGSANLAATFIQNRLIDEYRIMINPVVLGRGLPLFKDLNDRIHLTFVHARPFRNGNVLLYYQPEQIGNKGLIAKAALTVQASVSKVWEALTNPTIVKQVMFGAEVVTDWKEGSHILYRGMWEGKPFEDKGIVVRFQPERLLITTHWSPLSGVPDTPENYHTVCYELTPQDGGTLIILTQDNNATEDEKAHSESNWTMMLGNLKAILEK